MKINKRQPILWILLAIIFIGALLLAGLPAPVSQAGAGLPDRDTPVPAPPDDDGQGDKESGPVGAYIELQAPNAPAGAWAVVQWQNEQGRWYDVEGWQGSLPQNTRWWVAAKDFGDGPFRWVVKEGPAGAELGLSPPFDLPGEANETVRVAVSPAE